MTHLDVFNATVGLKLKHVRLAGVDEDVHLEIRTIFQRTQIN